MSGNARAIDQGTRMLARGGRMSLLGLPDGPVTLDLNDQVIFKEARILGITGREMFRTWQQTTTLLSTGRVDVSPVITHRFPLERFEEAFETAASGHAAKVIVFPGGAETPERLEVAAVPVAVRSVGRGSDAASAPRNGSVFTSGSSTRSRTCVVARRSSGEPVQVHRERNDRDSSPARGELALDAAETGPSGPVAERDAPPAGVVACGARSRVARRRRRAVELEEEADPDPVVSRGEQPATGSGSIRRRARTACPADGLTPRRRGTPRSRCAASYGVRLERMRWRRRRWVDALDYLKDELAELEDERAAAAPADAGGPDRRARDVRRARGHQPRVEQLPRPGEPSADERAPRPKAAARPRRRDRRGADDRRADADRTASWSDGSRRSSTPRPP